MLRVTGLEAIARIGSGGFADIYAAREVDLDRHVAVKVFRMRVSESTQRSFEREARSAGRLSGTRNIIHLYRSGVTDDGYPFLVMELMSGSLADRIADAPLDGREVVRLGCLLAAALSVAHEAGVLHRDIKPENILVDRYGEPVLSDFGISSLQDTGASSSIYAFSPQHAAPEMFESSRATPASDVYSLGSTLYALIEGSAPFVRGEDEGPMAFMRRVHSTEVPPSPRAAAVSSELAELLSAMMAKRPEARPTLDVVRRMLDEIQRSSGTSTESGTGFIVPDTPAAPTDGVQNDETSTVEPRPRPRRGRRRALLAVAAILAVSALAALAVTRDGDDADETESGGQAGQHAPDSSEPGAASGATGPLADERPTTDEERAGLVATVGALYPLVTPDQLTCLADGVFPQLSTESRGFITKSANVLALPPTERARVLAVISTCVPTELAAESALNFVTGSQLAVTFTKNGLHDLVDCLISETTSHVNTSGTIMVGSYARDEHVQRGLSEAMSACLDDTQAGWIVDWWLDVQQPDVWDCIRARLSYVAEISNEQILRQLLLSESRTAAPADFADYRTAAEECGASVKPGGTVANEDDRVSAQAFVDSSSQIEPSARAVAPPGS